MSHAIQGLLVCMCSFLIIPSLKDLPSTRKHTRIQINDSKWAVAFQTFDMAQIAKIGHMHKQFKFLLSQNG